MYNNYLIIYIKIIILFNNFNINNCLNYYFKYIFQLKNANKYAKYNKNICYKIKNNNLGMQNGNFIKMAVFYQK